MGIENVEVMNIDTDEEVKPDVTSTNVDVGQDKPAPETLPEEEFISEDAEETPAQDAEDADEKSSEDTSGEPELPERNNKRGKLPEWAQNRLEKEQRKAQEARTELENYRAQMAQVQQQTTASTQQNTPSQPQPYYGFNEPAPRRDQYADEDSYIDARFGYNQRKQQFEQHAVQQQQQAQRSQQAVANKLNDTVNKGAEAYDDFESVTKDIMYGDKIPHNPAMTFAVLDSEYGHDMLYFLGKYPEKALEIARSNPIQAVKKISELEVRFKERDKKVVKSKAPSPAAPVRTNNARSDDDIYKIAESGSQTAFERALEKHQSKRVNPW